MNHWNIYVNFSKQVWQSATLRPHHRKKWDFQKYSMGLPNFKGRKSGLPGFESWWKPCPRIEENQIQMTLLFKVIQDLMDIPALTNLTTASSRARANHTKKLRQFSSIRCLLTQFLPSNHPSLEFFAGHCGQGTWHGIIQAGALHSYFLSYGKGQSASRVQTPR